MVHNWCKIYKINMGKKKTSGICIVVIVNLYMIISGSIARGYSGSGHFNNIKINGGNMTPF